MKKNIFMISAAMLALVSCTKDEVIQINKGQKIEFRTAVTTRATELKQDDLTSFYVTALTDKDEPYFANIEFTKTGDTYFTSAVDYYWPAGGGLNFFAYYPSENELGGTITITSEKKMLEGYTPAEDIASQQDFVTAKAVGNKVEHSSSGVALEFKHQLSQIHINGKNENKGYEIKVKAIKIKNVIKTGNFNFAMGWGEWNLIENPTTDDLTDYIIEFDEAVTLTEASQSLMGGKGSAMLIPQSRPQWGNDTQNLTRTGDENNDTQDDTVVNGNGGEEVENDGEGEGEGDGDDETPSTPVTDPNGTYIAFLIQANTATGVRVFPTTEDVDYAWVAHPIAFSWANGYKYTYICDFSDGLGVIAPDPYDPDGPTGPTEPIIPGTPGEEVYGGKISVNVSFGSWSTNYSQDDGYDSYQPVDMKPQVPETEEEEEETEEGGENGEV